MYSKDKALEEKRIQIDDLQSSLQEITAMKTRLDKWAVILEQARLDDLLHNYTNPRRIIFFNLLAGLARGLGITIGTTIIVAILGYILKDFVSLPIIGEYIADLLDMIDTHRDDNN